MTTPWQLHQDLMRVTEAEIARASRHASQLTELRLSAGDRRRRVGAVLGALFRSRRIRPRWARRGSTRRAPDQLRYDRSCQSRNVSS
jgi:hypothetical protein